MSNRMRELVEALANDPWVDNGVRRVCRIMAEKWATEDMRKEIPEPNALELGSELRKLGEVPY